MSSPIALDSRRRSARGPASRRPEPPPRLQRGFVSRQRLLDRLPREADIPLVVVVAPAGYGKTTLLCDWAAHDQRRFAWVTADEAANDPGVLEARLLHALEGGATVLVLDDAQRVTAPEALRSLTALAHRLAPGTVLVLASRRPPPMPLGRLRAHRLVVELGPRELALTTAEAGQLVAAMGVRLPRETVDDLVRRTEGWPAVLYLAALAAAEDGAPAAQRLIADYVRDTVLDDLGPQLEVFLRESAVLEELTGPACDVVLGRQDSGARLDDLVAAGVPLTPPDAGLGEHRHHRLLAEVLRVDLERLDPRRAAELHRRASEWYERGGDLDRAIDHARSAHDREHAAQMLWASVPEKLASGRAADVEALAAADQLTGSAWAAASLAACRLVAGDGDGVHYWSGCATRDPEATTGSDVAAAAHVIAAVATGGPAGAAARARASLEPGSPWVALGHFVEGATAHLEGRRDAAREALEEGVRTGAVVAPWAQALCLAQLGLLAAEDDDWAEAAARGYRARSLLQSARLTGYPVVALVAAVSAAAGAHRGQTQAAEEDAETADRLLAGLGTFAPWYVAETQVWLARARLRLADVAAAHEGLEDARRSVRDAGSPPSLVGWLEAAERRARAFADGASPALTPAELRVLRHLPSHRSFREIGEQLFVSPNTVKTQALAIYRKLGAASRSEAVARAQALDLLDAPTHPERNA